MAYVFAFLGFVFACFVSVLLSVIANDVHGRVPEWAKRLLDFAATLLPASLRTLLCPVWSEALMAKRHALDQIAFATARVFVATFLRIRDRWSDPESVYGVVKFFTPVKGFGFIGTADGSHPVFVHITAVRDAGLSSLKAGKVVRYRLVLNRGRPCAVLSPFRFGWWRQPARCVA